MFQDNVVSDESIHRDYICARFRESSDNKKLSCEEVIEMFTEASDVEIAFVTTLTNEPEPVVKYIHHTRDTRDTRVKLLTKLGFEPNL